MKLYYIPASCSLSPHIVLNELGLDAELVKVDYKTHTTQAGGNYLDVNELGYVPILELDDGARLREGPVIVQYLADRKPEAGLAAPAGTMARYRLQEWLAMLSSEVHKGFIPLLYARQAGPYAQVAKEKLARRYAWIDRQLAGAQWLMGERYSVADAYLYALTGWGQAEWMTSRYNADIHFDGLPGLQAWYARMHARPAVQQALKEEGLA
ncbi:glutathione transferase GstA [Bordetella genomosp. 10]|uniref:Glutathione transferase GstA n=1 Tax=Bordetella genomosp. 10 TaxID=1416804 RepID=A0A261SMP8_9BORD|nr:glutathione transferase GstA [Bordetella genomosp. 10]OZI37583.1 glutathione transferase GstA [Bordetella genomosp. 10]